MNLGTYFYVIFVLKMQSTEIYSNIIDSKKCTLTKDANPKTRTAKKIKEKYLTDNGFGVTSLLNSDKTMVSDLRDHDKIKHICGCITFTLDSNVSSKYNFDEWFKTIIMNYTEIDLKYSYCVKFFEWISFSTYCSPIIKCIAGEDEFFIAESKTSYEERKFRDIFVFELNKTEKWILKNLESDENKVNHPMGKFIAAFSKVDLEYFVVNEIDLEKCKLNDIEISNSDVTKQDKLKDQFDSEYGFGVLNYAKLDWGPITSLQKEYIQAICYCFARVYFPRANVIRNSSEIDVKTNFYYFKECLFYGLFKKYVRSPVVQCMISTLEKTFYLAESAKFHFSRRFRNIYFFIADEKDLKYIEDTKEFIINDPAGTFELVAPAVNLKKCYDPDSIPTNG